MSVGPRADARSPVRTADQQAPSRAGVGAAIATIATAARRKPEAGGGTRSFGADRRAYHLVSGAAQGPRVGLVAET